MSQHFYPSSCHPAKKNHSAGLCHVCWRQKMKVENPEILRNPPGHRTSGLTRKEYMRIKNLRRNFGITAEQYDAMFDSQHGVCKLCFAPPGKRRLAVDHCHKTGKVRGLLCTKCNTSLGFAERFASAVHGKWLMNARYYLDGLDLRS